MQFAIKLIASLVVQGDFKKAILETELIRPLNNIKSIIMNYD
jgi:hypothetical protein